MLKDRIIPYIPYSPTKHDQQLKLKSRDMFTIKSPKLLHRKKSNEINSRGRSLDLKELITEQAPNRYNKVSELVAHKIHMPEKQHISEGENYP